MVHSRLRVYFGEGGGGIAGAPGARGLGHRRRSVLLRQQVPGQAGQQRVGQVGREVAQQPADRTHRRAVHHLARRPLHHLRMYRNTPVLVSPCSA
jgi:hypothetical protein